MDQIKKDGLKLICTHLRLVFAADVNILKENNYYEKTLKLFQFLVKRIE
jgi:hypothetical protein